MAPDLSAFRGLLTRVVLAMPTSQVGAATRAFVALLLLLARRYELVLEVNRESSPEELVKAYKSLFRKVHPDKGGKKEDAQRLQGAREDWEKARKAAPPQGGRRSAQADVGPLVVVPGRSEKQERGKNQQRTKKNQRKEY